jgi:hypothetical protein
LPSRSKSAIAGASPTEEYCKSAEGTTIAGPNDGFLQPEQDCARDTDGKPRKVAEATAAAKRYRLFIRRTRPILCLDTRTSYQRVPSRDTTVTAPMTFAE